MYFLQEKKTRLQKDDKHHEDEICNLAVLHENEEKVARTATCPILRNILKGYFTIIQVLLMRRAFKILLAFCQVK